MTLPDMSGGSDFNGIYVGVSLCHPSVQTLKSRTFIIATISKDLDRILVIEPIWMID